MARETVSTGKAFETKIPHSAGVVASGRFLFTSGLVARDDDGNVVGAGDMAAQLDRVLANVADVLRQAGADWAQVVKFTIYVTDIDAYRQALAGRRDHMVGGPAATLVEVSRLADPALMVEIEAIVALD